MSRRLIDLLCQGWVVSCELRRSNSLDRAIGRSVGDRGVGKEQVDQKSYLSFPSELRTWRSMLMMRQENLPNLECYEDPSFPGPPLEVMSLDLPSALSSSPFPLPTDLSSWRSCRGAGWCTGCCKFISSAVLPIPFSMREAIEHMFQNWQFDSYILSFSLAVIRLQQRVHLTWKTMRKKMKSKFVTGSIDQGKEGEGCLGIQLRGWKVLYCWGYRAMEEIKAQYKEECSQECKISWRNEIVNLIWATSIIFWSWWRS